MNQIIQDSYSDDVFNYKEAKAKFAGEDKLFVRSSLAPTDPLSQVYDDAILVLYQTGGSFRDNLKAMLNNPRNVLNGIAYAGVGGDDAEALRQTLLGISNQADDSSDDDSVIDDSSDGDMSAEESSDESSSDESSSDESSSDESSSDDDYSNVGPLSGSDSDEEEEDVPVVTPQAPQRIAAVQAGPPVIVRPSRIVAAASARPTVSSQVVQPSRSLSRAVPAVVPALRSQVVQPLRAAAPAVKPMSDAELQQVYRRASRNPAAIAADKALMVRVAGAAKTGNQTAQGIMKFVQNVR